MIKESGIMKKKKKRQFEKRENHNFYKWKIQLLKLKLNFWVLTSILETAEDTFLRWTEKSIEMITTKCNRFLKEVEKYEEKIFRNMEDRMRKFSIYSMGSLEERKDKIRGHHIFKHD